MDEAVKMLHSRFGKEAVGAKASGAQHIFALFMGPPAPALREGAAWPKGG
jgi:hypothetical protein